MKTNLIIAAIAAVAGGVTVTIFGATIRAAIAHGLRVAADFVDAK